MSWLRQFVKNWLLPPGLVSLIVTIKKRLKSSASDRGLLSSNIQLKDRHKGSRCFLLGAGPSVKNQDISKLEGEIVISVSNTFVHPDFQKIKPQYHVLSPLLLSHGRWHSEENFVTWLQEMEKATGQAEMFIHIGDKPMIEKNGLFKNRVIHWVEYSDWDGDFNTPIDLANIPRTWSVSELALTAAVYLGFEDIYLIGIDHDWFNSAIVYFYDHTKQHLLRPDQCDLSFVDSEFQMRRHAEIFRKYKYLYSFRKNIYNANANPNTYVDVFPKVDFDSLFDGRPAA